MNEEERGKQFKHLTATTTTNTQVDRVLCRKVEAMRRADERGRMDTFTLINSVLSVRRMPPSELLLLGMLRVCVLDSHTALFDQFARFFSGHAKNGHRPRAMHMLQNERIRLCSIYLEMGGQERKSSLREQIEIVGKVRKPRRTPQDLQKLKELEDELGAFAGIERAVERIDGLTRR